MVLMLLLDTALVVLLLCPWRMHMVESLTYGAPVLDLDPFDSSRLSLRRHVGDPVAFLDLAAQTSFASGLNPHSSDLVMGPRVALSKVRSPEVVYLIGLFYGIKFAFPVDPQPFGLSKLLSIEIQKKHQGTFKATPHSVSSQPAVAESVSAP